MKKLTFLILGSLLFGTTVYAAPYFRQEAGLVPITDSIYYLGTTTPATKAWKGLIVDEICLTADSCKTAWPTSTGAPFAWTPTSWGVSTSTTLGFLNGFLSTASSTINSTFRLPLLSDGMLTIFGGTVSSAATTTAGTGINYSANAFSVDQTFSPTWTGAHIFNNITRSTTTQATSTNFFSTHLWGTNGVFGNILPSSNDSGALGASGTAFSDLFLASGGVINFNAGDVLLTHSSNTLVLSGASAGYHFEGTIYPNTNDGGALGGIGQQWSDLFLAEGGVINWDNGDFTLTQANNLLTVAGGGVDAGGADSLEVPNGASPTVDAAGEIAVDTTTGQLKWYDGAKVQTLTGTTTKSFNIASTTLDAMGKSFNSATSTFLLANFPEAMTMSSFYCVASTTGTALVRFGDPAGNYTETASVTSGGLTNTASNNTWTAYEGLTMQASSTAGTVSRITCTVNMYKTAD